MVVVPDSARIFGSCNRATSTSPRVKRPSRRSGAASQSRMMHIATGGEMK